MALWLILFLLFIFDMDIIPFSRIALVISEITSIGMTFLYCVAGTVLYNEARKRCASSEGGTV